jgi:hypothetical protein
MITPEIRHHKLCDKKIRTLHDAIKSTYYLEKKKREQNKTN